MLTEPWTSRLLLGLAVPMPTLPKASSIIPESPIVPAPVPLARAVGRDCCTGRLRVGMDEGDYFHSRHRLDGLHLASRRIRAARSWIRISSKWDHLDNSVPLNDPASLLRPVRRVGVSRVAVVPQVFQRLLHRLVR